MTGIVNERRKERKKSQERREDHKIPRRFGGNQTIILEPWNPWTYSRNRKTGSCKK